MGAKYGLSSPRIVLKHDESIKYGGCYSWRATSQTSLAPRDPTNAVSIYFCASAAGKPTEGAGGMRSDASTPWPPLACVHGLRRPKGRFCASEYKGAVNKEATLPSLECWTLVRAQGEEMTAWDMLYDCSGWNNPYYGTKSLNLVRGGVQYVTVEPQQSLGSAWKLHYSAPLDAAMIEASSGVGELETSHVWRPWEGLTWWPVMSRAVHTKIPDTTRATTVFKKNWSSRMAPVPVRMMVMLETSDLSGRIGASRWTMEPFWADEAMTSAEKLIWNTHPQNKSGVKMSLLLVWMLPSKNTWIHLDPARDHRLHKLLFYCQRADLTPRSLDQFWPDKIDIYG